jgi:hypothetical protein
MIKLSFKTKKGQKEILDKAVQFFEKNTGLKRTDRGSCCVIFGEMYTDYVMVSLSQEDDTFEVTVESREHEYLAQKFVEEFKQ